MRVQIYQINEQRDREHKHYASFKSGDTVDPSIYDEVFDAEIDENDMRLELFQAPF